MDKKTKKVIRLLTELEAAIPDDLWLFAADGKVHLMQSRDGERATLPHGGFDPDCIIQSFEIDADGGGW